MNKQILFVTLILLISSQCMSQEIEPLEKSPLDILQCLYSSPIIAKDVKVFIELFKEKDYIKIISFIIEKFPEIQQEVKRCLQNETELSLGDGYTNDDEEEEEKTNFSVNEYFSCIKCYTLKRYPRVLRELNCIWNCDYSSCQTISMCSSYPEYKNSFY